MVKPMPITHQSIPVHFEAPLSTASLFKSGSPIVSGAPFVYVGTRGELTGAFTTSPNGAYMLGWGGATYTLFRGEYAILSGKMVRPWDGHVANNGTFIISDWLSPGKKSLAGIFYAADESGRQIVLRRFKANLYSSGLSPDGHLAVCQTADASNSDGGKLFCYDLLTGQLRWAKIPDTGWASEYRFNIETNILYLADYHRGEFAYQIGTGEHLPGLP